MRINIFIISRYKSIMTESVDSVIEGFPYSTIEKHTGEPNYQVIKEVE